MTTVKAPGPFRIVVGVDFSETSQEALHQAFDQALSRRTESPEVHAVVVVDDGSGGVPLRRVGADIKEQLETAQALITDQVAAIRRFKLQGEPPGTPTIRTEVQVRVGDAVDQIVSVALELRASLVVVGTHGRRGVRRLVLGSVAERVARTAPCPVLIARRHDFLAMESVARVEPANPGSPPPSETEAHVYRYHSVLEPETPTNHLL